MTKDTKSMELFNFWDGPFLLYTIEYLHGKESKINALKQRQTSTKTKLQILGINTSFCCVLKSSALRQS